MKFPCVTPAGCAAAAANAAADTSATGVCYCCCSVVAYVACCLLPAQRSFRLYSMIRFVVFQANE